MFYKRERGGGGGLWIRNIAKIFVRVLAVFKYVFELETNMAIALTPTNDILTQHQTDP